MRSSQIDCFLSLSSFSGGIVTFNFDIWYSHAFLFIQLLSCVSLKLHKIYIWICTFGFYHTYMILESHMQLDQMYFFKFRIIVIGSMPKGEWGVRNMKGTGAHNGMTRTWASVVEKWNKKGWGLKLGWKRNGYSVVWSPISHSPWLPFLKIPSLVPLMA